jgi:hypothetical protein
MQGTDTWQSEEPEALSLGQFMAIHFLLIARCVAVLVMLGLGLLWALTA